jgi:hypothetical protein
MNDLLDCFFKPYGLGYKYSALCHFDAALCCIAQKHDSELCYSYIAQNRDYALCCIVDNRHIFVNSSPSTKQTISGHVSEAEGLLVDKSTMF